MESFVITIANQKGGVGKTTTAVTLAAALAALGINVLLVDCDPQGNGAQFLGSNDEDGLYELIVEKADVKDVVTSMSSIGYPKLAVISGGAGVTDIETLLKTSANRFPVATILRDRLERVLKTKNTIVILDTAPSLSEMQLAALCATDLLIIPTTAEYAGETGVAALYNTVDVLRDKGIPLRLFAIQPTMVKSQSKEHAASLERLKDKFGDLVLPPIRNLVAFGETPGRGIPIWDHSKKAADDYAPLMGKVLEYVEA